MSDPKFLPADELLGDIAEAIDAILDEAMEHPERTAFGLFVFDCNGNGRMCTNVPRESIVAAVEHWLESARKPGSERQGQQRRLKVPKRLN